MDIAATILSGIATISLALIALFPQRPRKWLRAILIVLFVGCGLLGVALSGVVQYQVRVQIATERLARRQIREQLAAFVQEGMELRRLCANEGVPPPIQQADEWAMRTEAFLRDKLDESYVARFRNSSGLPLTANSISSIPHRNLWGAIYTRLARLNQFLEELSTNEGNN